MRLDVAILVLLLAFGGGYAVGRVRAQHVLEDVRDQAAAEVNQARARQQAAAEVWDARRQELQGSVDSLEGVLELAQGQLARAQQRVRVTEVRWRDALAQIQDTAVAGTIEEHVAAVTEEARACEATLATCGERADSISALYVAQARYLRSTEETLTNVTAQYALTRSAFDALKRERYGRLRVLGIAASCGAGAWGAGADNVTLAVAGLAGCLFLVVR